MARRRNDEAPADDAQPTQSTEDGDSQATVAAAEVAALIAPEQERGYFGTVPDPHPNSAYSLASGPDAPPLTPDNRTRNEQFSVPSDKEG